MCLAVLFRSRATKEKNKRDKISLLKMYHRITAKGYLISGLCWEAESMSREGLLDFSQFNELMDYLDKNAPQKRYARHKGFWFKPGLIEPRLKWLDEQIKNLP